MRRNAIQLTRRHKAVLYLSTLVVLASGVAWSWLHYYGVKQGEFGPEFSPLEPTMLKIHGAAAIAITLVVGSLLTVHVKKGWQARLNLPSGIGLLTIFGFLIATGYGLYYLADERLRSLTSLSHLWVGFALPIILVIHVVVGHRVRHRLHQERRAEQSRPGLAE